MSSVTYLSTLPYSLHHHLSHFHSLCLKSSRSHSLQFPHCRNVLRPRCPPGMAQHCQTKHVGDNEIRDLKSLYTFIFSFIQSTTAAVYVVMEHFVVCSLSDTYITYTYSSKQCKKHWEKANIWQSLNTNLKCIALNMHFYWHNIAELSYF